MVEEGDGMLGVDGSGTYLAWQASCGSISCFQYMLRWAECTGERASNIHD